nr:MAG TPA: hypothetical protein [Caudoviricetes sp.]
MQLLSPVTKHVKSNKIRIVEPFERGNPFLKGLFILLTFANYKIKPKPHIL